MKKRALLVSGLALVAVSAPVLALAARELAISTSVNARYAVRDALGDEGSLRARIGEHQIELIDDVKDVAGPSTEVDRVESGTVTILIDGKARSTLVAPIRIAEKSANRYWGTVHLFRLVDREGPEREVVAQRRGETYRVTSLFADGRVEDDEFGYEGRCTPPLRALLIRYVVGHPSGFCSDVMTGYPSFLVPVLYPIASAAAGLVLVLFAVLHPRVA